MYSTEVKGEGIPTASLGLSNRNDIVVSVVRLPALAMAADTGHLAPNALRSMSVQRGTASTSGQRPNNNQPT